jgi:alpha-D-xyloside xylohydrolase
MLRAMLLEFPDDPTCAHLDLQYMLGDSLLVAPIFAHDGSVTYYIPEGRWTNLLNGEQVEGPGWKRETHDFMSLPLLVRPNAVIPMGSHSDRPDYDFSKGLTLHIFSFDDGQSTKVEIPSTDGKIETTFEIERKANEIHIQRHGVEKAWNVALFGKPTLTLKKQISEASIQLA